MRRVAPLAVLLLAGCGGGGGGSVKGTPPAAPQRIQLSSPVFPAGGTIPTRFTCDGEGLSPPLGWSGVPRGAKRLALLLEDPDAPGGTFVHWVVLGIPATAHGLPEGRVPAGAVEARQSFGHEGYGAPCPPKGDKAHRYVFSLYALRGSLPVSPSASPGKVTTAIGKAALARGVLTARYRR